jgi:hypothetical protein
MKRSARVFTQRSALLAAAMLTASPSLGASPFEVRSFAGAPRVAVSGGRLLAWRNVGVIAESDIVDVEAKIAACSTRSASAAIDFSGGAGTSCPAGFASGAGAAPSHEFGTTLKIPRWHEDAPLVDVTVRNWRPPLRTSAGRASATGSAATASVTHFVGPFEASYGYTTPLASASAPEKWRSAFAGISWRSATGATIEFVADRGRDAATGQVDRTFTLRLLHAGTVRGLRLAAYATFAPDDPTGARRAGVGIDYAF